MFKISNQKKIKKSAFKDKNTKTKKYKNNTQI